MRMIKKVKLIIEVDEKYYEACKDAVKEPYPSQVEKVIANGKPYEERLQGEWIPITYRPMTEEEVKRVETYFGLPLDEEEKKCFSCPMPEHGQEILISTEWGVSKDICLYDCDEGYSLDGRGDWEDVDAWMPLPEAYKKGGEEE